MRAKQSAQFCRWSTTHRMAGPPVADKHARADLEHRWTFTLVACKTHADNLLGRLGVSGTAMERC